MDAVYLHRRLVAGDISLWVGAGISYDRLGGLEQFFVRFLRRLSALAVDLGTASNEAKLLSELLADYDEEDVHNAELPFDEWADCEKLLKRMLVNYSGVVLLAINRLGTPAKAGVFDIPGFYGESQDFDLEHEVIIALLAERLVCEVITTNWDALIEAAASVRCPNLGLSVVADSSDTVDLGPGPMLIKIHGCARRALHPELNMPSGIIVVSERDIKELGEPANVSLLEKVRTGIREHACLFVGLSGQDCDLQSLLFESRLADLSANLTPRVFFAEKDGLNKHQKKMLSYLYPSNVYVGDTSRSLEDQASIELRSKPALTALLILGLTEKCSALLKAIPIDFPEYALAAQADQWLWDTASDWLQSRNGTGQIEVGEWRRIALDVLSTTSTSASLYREQSPAFLDGVYAPITTDSPQHILDAGEAADGMMHRLVMLLIYMSHAAQIAGMAVTHGGPDGSDGHLLIETKAGPIKIFMVRRSYNRAFGLIENGVLDPSDPSAIVIYAQGQEPQERKFNAESDLPLPSEYRFQEIYLEQEFLRAVHDPATAVAWLQTAITGGGTT